MLISTSIGRRFCSGEAEEIFGRLRLREIDGEDFGLYFVPLAQFAGQLLEPLGAPRGEDEVRATRGQLRGEFPADACAGSGDQRPFALPVRHSEPPSCGYCSGTMRLGIIRRRAHGSISRAM